jgi:hypothetical protein
LRDPDVEALFKELPSLVYFNRERISRFPSLARVNSYHKGKRRTSVDIPGQDGSPAKPQYAARRKSSVLEAAGIVGEGEIRRGGSMASQDQFGRAAKRMNSKDNFGGGTRKPIIE